MSELTVGTISGLAANGYVVDVADGSTIDLANSSNLPNSALPAGSILQVITSEASTASIIESTSGSYTSSNLSATITPKRADSKILVTLMEHIDTADVTHVYYGIVYRNNDGNLTQFSTGAMSRVHHVNGTRILMNQYSNAVDTPNTTSSITYEAYFKSGASGDLVRLRNDIVPARLTLMEIAQ